MATAGGTAALAPALAPGVEALGVHQGSGYREAPVLLRLDGRTMEVSPLLYLVCEALNGVRSLDEVADLVSSRAGRAVTAADVAYLLEHKLAPLGLVAGPEGGRRAPRPGPPLLSLTARTAVLPSPAVRAVTGPLRVLFRPGIIAVAVLGLLALDGWLIATADPGRVLRQVAVQPELLLVLAVLTLLGGAFHELGHATACRYGGAEPGVIGVGVYLVWPVFYNDLNDSYRLDRAGRLRADLGGVYFNVVLTLALGAGYLLTGFAPLVAAVAGQHLAIAHQFLPFVRLDGYYVVSDLAGVPDLFGRIGPVLSSLRPGRPLPPAVSQLTDRARATVTAWAVLTVVALATLLSLLAVGLPNLVRTGWQSVFIHGRSFAAAWHEGAVWAGTVDVIRIVLLAVPPLGIVLVLGRAAEAAAAGLRRRSPSVALESR